MNGYTFEQQAFSQFLSLQMTKTILYNLLCKPLCWVAVLWRRAGRWDLHCLLVRARFALQDNGKTKKIIGRQDDVSRNIAGFRQWKIIFRKWINLNKTSHGKKKVDKFYFKTNSLKTALFANGKWFPEHFIGIQRNSVGLDEIIRKKFLLKLVTNLHSHCLDRRSICASNAFNSSLFKPSPSSRPAIFLPRRFLLFTSEPANSPPPSTPDSS